MRPQRLVKQIVDWWNERGLEGVEEGTKCGTILLLIRAKHHYTERWGPSCLPPYSTYPKDNTGN